MSKVIDSTNLGYLISKIKAAFWKKSETSELTIDATPTASSNNLVKSGGVYSALADKQDTLVFNTTYNASSNKVATMSDIPTVTDTKVTQSVSTSSNTSWRPLLLGYSYSDGTTFSPSTVTNTTIASHLGKFAPSTGILAVTGLKKMATDGTMVTGSDSTAWNTNGGTTTIPTVGTLNTDNSTAQSVNSSEALSGTVKLHKVSKTGSYNDLLDKPTIPSISGLESTSNKVSSWSSTTTNDHYPSEKLVKDSLDAKYVKPSDGIPATDLENGVQLTLDSAILGPINDDIFGRTSEDELTIKDGSIAKAKLASGVQTSLGKADTAIQGIKVNGTTQTPDANKVVNVQTLFMADEYTAYSAIEAARNSGKLLFCQDADTGVICQFQQSSGTGEEGGNVYSFWGYDYNSLDDNSYNIIVLTVHEDDSWDREVRYVSNFNGSYNSLTDKPTIPSAPGTLNTTASTAQSTSASEALSGSITLHKIAKTGTYSDLIGTPTISTDISANATSDVMTTSPKAVKTFVEGKGYTSNTGTVTGITAGVGLNTTSNDTGTDGGTISSSGTLYLTKSGVTAGTYQGITVDKYGRVTAASNQGYTTNTGTVTGVTVGTTAYTPTSGVVTIPAYPSVPTIVTDIAANTTSTTTTASPSAVYNEVHPAIVTTQPAGGFAPNVMYDLGTVTGTVSFSLASPTDTDIVNHYFWTFETSTTAPTINWPNSTVWYGDDAPTISASKHYEVSILYDDSIEKFVTICIETAKS